MHNLKAETTPDGSSALGKPEWCPGEIVAAEQVAADKPHPEVYEPPIYHEEDY